MAMGSRRGKAGGISVTRLRRWLLVGVVVLLVALTGFLGIARYKARRLLHDLPGKLGIDIKNQADGFTISRSVKGHTLFTLHAAKAIQRQNGKTTLHDVAITLYGPEGSHETDSIRGAEFDYDQPNQIVRAMGESHLDLASPAAAQQGKADAKRISATTTGLVFLQKLGVAATDQPLHVDYGDLHADATGADYETDTGILHLRSAVTMHGTQGGKPVHLTAASAELDRTRRLTTLHTATVHSDDTQASGDLVVLDAGPSGGIDEIRADGHATIQSGDGVRAQAPKLVAKLSEQGKPTIAVMQRYSTNRYYPLQQTWVCGNCRADGGRNARPKLRLLSRPSHRRHCRLSTRAGCKAPHHLAERHSHWTRAVSFCFDRTTCEDNHRLR